MTRLEEIETRLLSAPCDAKCTTSRAGYSPGKCMCKSRSDTAYLISEVKRLEGALAQMTELYEHALAACPELLTNNELLEAENERLRGLVGELTSFVGRLRGGDRPSPTEVLVHWKRGREGLAQADEELKR